MADNAPLLLGDLVSGRSRRLVAGPSSLCYPHHWQVPAATEKAASEAAARAVLPPSVVYVGFPWATLIDGLRSRAAVAFELLRVLDEVRAAIAARKPDLCVTVAQHIHAGRFMDICRTCGITDVLWSHARKDQPRIDGVAIHPFPLFPAQTPDGIDPADPHRPRRYLANFIGAFNPKVYLTNVREMIFSEAGAADLLIIRREAWHFERAVYAEQIGGAAADAARLAVEAREKAEYLDAIRDSTFTLCPTGSGPNSIRIGEALALASIPIILTRDLAMPGPRSLWEAACLFEDDSADGYRRALARARAMRPDEILSRQRATRALFEAVGPQAWGALIAATVAALRPVTGPARSRAG
jgi:hypothetical protein